MKIQSNLNKTVSVKLPFGFVLSLQLRNSQQTRKEDFAPIIIDESKKAQAISEINIDDLRAKARAMRAIHQGE